MISLTEGKIIQDPLYGPIRIEGIFLELVDTPEFQRLRNIKQLGLCYLVFPEANHTRFSHSLGTYFLLSQMESIWRDKDLYYEKIAGLLHDIGHPPFSHTFEDIFKGISGKSHEDLGCDIITGSGESYSSRINAILEKHGVDTKKIAGLLNGTPTNSGEFIPSLISGPLDMDELDYLRRDAFFCGVPIGNIDFSRLLNTMEFDGPNLYVKEKGLTALESLYINRFFMYRTVYFHRTVRIASLMVRKSLEAVDDESMLKAVNMDDFHFVDLLLSRRETRDTWESVQRRDIFKTVFRTPYTKKSMHSIETSLNRNGMKDGVLIDIIPPLSFSGSSGLKTTQLIQMGNELKVISEVSEVVRSLSAVLDHRTICISSRRDMEEAVMEALRESVS